MRHRRTEVTAWHTSDTEIRNLCKYLPDDQQIAAYLGIDPKRVKRVRAAIPELKLVPVGEMGIAAVRRMEREEAAERANWTAGCERLRLSLECLFARFERDNGLQKGAGKILLPAGWGGWE